MQKRGAGCKTWGLLVTIFHMGGLTGADKGGDRYGEKKKLVKIGWNPTWFMPIMP